MERSAAMTTAKSEPPVGYLHSPWLDFARALASFLVCFAHLRAFFLVDFDASGGGPVAQVFYLLTGLHHQAVMVFFVLSGFLVGGALLREAGGPQGVDWLTYTAKRVTRLWLVLVPALLLTLLWDKIGMYLVGGAPYQGQFHELLNSGPTPSNPADHSLRAFLGNLLFLQTIVVQAYGSNLPLWSLAYEGWYYLLFPLILLAGSGNFRLLPWTFLTIFTAFLILIGPAVLVLGVNWLFGVGVFWLISRPRIALLCRGLPFRVATMGLLVATLLASRAGLWIGHDLLVGFAFAGVVAWLAPAAMPSAVATKASAFGADFSYTLYLVHFPFQAFLFFVFAKGQQMAFDAYSMIILLLLFALCLAYALLVWWFFERNTNVVRKRVVAAIRSK